MSLNKNSKAEIWNHFEKKEEKARCCYCLNDFSYSQNSTGNLKRHLARKHPTVPTTSGGSYKYVEPTKATSSTAAPATKMAENMERFLSRPIPTGTKKEMDSQLLLMICKGYHPFSIVEEDYFIKFVKSLKANYEIPSRKTLSNALLPSIYQSTLESVKVQLNLVKAIALTTDAWTNINMVSFCAITCHFINDSGQLDSYVLECSEFSENHTANNIQFWIKTVMEKFDIADKIVAIVTDNAKNMKLAVSMLDMQHIPCFAHSLNLIIQNGITKSIKSTVEKVKNVVSHFKKSSKATLKLNEMQTHLKVPNSKLKQDVVTRWNSTFDMLSRFLQNKDPILSCIGVLGIKSNLKDEDWDIIQQSVEILDFFDLATKDICAEKSPTISKIVVLCKLLNLQMKKAQSKASLRKEVKDLVDCVIHGLSERFKITPGGIVAQAILLDPRYKKDGFMGDEQMYNEAYATILEEVIADQSVSSQNENDSSGQSTRTQEIDNRLWAEYDLVVRSKPDQSTPRNNAKRQLDSYIKEENIDRRDDAIDWWRKNQLHFPSLYKIASKVLCIPASSVPCERIFSKTGQIVTEKRNRLLPKNLERIVFVAHNFRK